jgi:hypothetical protein
MTGGRDMKCIRLQNSVRVNFEERLLGRTKRRLEDNIKMGRR